MDRSRNRSDSYQYNLLESACSPEIINEVPSDSSIQSLLNPFGYNEEFLNLKEELRIAFWRLVDTKLTKRQKEVIHLVANGLTQTEIARKLGVNQSSITKSLNGNCDYKNDRKIYGGAKRRILKLAEKDREIQEIFAKIKELQSE